MGWRAVYSRASVSQVIRFIRLANCFLVILLTCVHASAQTQCQNPPNNAALNSNGKPSGWAQGQQVNAIIDSTQWNSSQIAAIKQAFTSWQNSSNNAQVTYNFVVVAGQQVPTGNYIIIRRETPTDPTKGGQVTWTTTLNTSGTLNDVNNANMKLNPTLAIPPS